MKKSELQNELERITTRLDGVAEDGESWGDVRRLVSDLKKLADRLSYSNIDNEDDDD